MRILFHIAHDGFLRPQEPTIRELARRGHEIIVASDRFAEQSAKTTLDLPRLRADIPGLTVERGAFADKGAWFRHPAAPARFFLDYLHYQRPEFGTAPALQDRAIELLPKGLRPWANHPVLNGKVNRRFVERGFKEIVHSAPPDSNIAAYLEERRPDLLVLTPVIYSSPHQWDYIRTARFLGIPTALVVNSWDNLTTKGKLHENVESLIVWNDDQRREAVELHGANPETVAICGAPHFDVWFDRGPSRTRAQLQADAGLPTDRPYLLYLGSSPFLAPYEPQLALRWLELLRNRGGLLSEVGVLFRPHPLNPFTTERPGVEELSAAPGVAIWPAEGQLPSDQQARDDFYDSIAHSHGLVGLNTTAMIEGAILGKPTHALTDPTAERAHEGMLHFRYLRAESGGPVYVTTDPEAHLNQLERSVRDGGHDPAARAFAERFTRPAGSDVRATVVVADELERTAAGAVRAPEDTRLGPVLRALLPRLVPGVGMKLADRAVEDVRPARRTRVDPLRGERPLRMLMVLPYPGYMRYYDSVLKELARRGHEIVLAFELPTKQVEGLDALAGTDGIELGRLVPGVPADWKFVTQDIRRSHDYLRFFAFETLEHAHALRRRAGDVLKGPTRGFLALEWMPHGVARRVARAGLALTSRLELSVPSHRAVERFIDDVHPDVVYVAPLVTDASRQNDVAKSTRALGLPLIGGPASWDNLTNKGQIKIRPQRLLVWNDIQRDEAVDVHGIQPETIVVTGAQPFDRWFERTPSDRDAFLEAVGLDPVRPYLLYVGSTASISAPEVEAAFVRLWIDALGQDRRFSEVQVMVRPHPYNSSLWTPEALEDYDNAVVHPADGANPVDEIDRQTYFDSLFHSAAVVGVNTSAMVEAAIVGRPVLSIRDKRFTSSQSETVHFRYLLAENGGPVLPADTMEQHMELLADILRDATPHQQRSREFAFRFTRPQRNGMSSTELVVRAIESSVLLPPDPLPEGSEAARRALHAYGVARLTMDRGMVSKRFGRWGKKVYQRFDATGQVVERRTFQAARLVRAVGKAGGATDRTFDDVAHRLELRGLKARHKFMIAGKRTQKVFAKAQAKTAPPKKVKVPQTRATAEAQASEPREAGLGNRP